MPKKKKSQNKPVLDAPMDISKHTVTKKVIVCHCWPGVYEAACRLLNNYSNDKLNGEKITMSKFINIIISAIHVQCFGTMPDFNNENQKGEN